MEKELENFCYNLNQLCKEKMQEEKEIIEDELAFKAYMYIKFMNVSTFTDALLYCSSLNVLNTYVKQENNLIGYRFKKEIDPFIESIFNKKIENVYFCNDEKNLIIVQFYSLQFSFHSVSYQIKFKEGKIFKTFKWDGIRKQNCAKTIFNEILNYNIGKSNLTNSGENLNNTINKLILDYRNEIINFDTFH